MQGHTVAVAPEIQPGELYPMSRDGHRRKRKQERITAEFNLPGMSQETEPGVAAGTPASVQAIAYGPEGYDEKIITDVSDLISLIANWPVTWINVDPNCEGPPALMVVEQFAKIFNLHELAVEDVVNVHQRSKVEEYGDQLFIVTRMLISPDEARTEQLSLFLSKKFVLTFREVPKDCLDPVREKIRKAKGRIRNESADYLMYAIIDAVVDSYFPLLTTIAQRLDVIEDQILEDSDEEAPSVMYQTRRDLLFIRRAVWPAREALSSLTRDSVPLVSETTRLYLRDCYDHAVRIIDFVEMYREVSSALMEVYYTRSNNRLNEAMKVLTVITTLLLPPTLIAGIYGMNFNTAKSPFNMPELDWYFGYPLALLLMVVISVSLYAFLNWKGWLGNRKSKPASGALKTQNGTN